MNRLLVEGQRVRLELDVQERDRYGRVLAYVWVERDGEEIMVNAELLRLGYAQVMTIPPNVGTPSGSSSCSARPERLGGGCGRHDDADIRHP